MSDDTDGVSAAQLAAGNAQTYMNNAQSYATQASGSAAVASGAAATAAQAAQSATQQAAALLSWLGGTAQLLDQFKDTDSIGFARAGQLYSVNYSALKTDIQSGLLQAKNDLEDVADPSAALANLGGVGQGSVKSSLVSNTTTSASVSTTFSFTPGSDGLLSSISNGGSAGSSTPSLGLDIEVTTTQGCTLLNSQGNGTGSYNFASFFAQFSVKAGVPVTVTITQTAPPGTSNSNLSSLFIYLPG
jgi:hypothetical protein